MKELSDLTEFEQALTASDRKPVFILKHSTRCPISAAAFKVVAEYEKKPQTPDFYLVKVIEARPVSNAVAATLAIQHQSPQLILVESRQAVWAATHYGITTDAIDHALKRPPA